eukprot:TRINITY_DN4931_c0_g1_i6.p1 TRINITY_DN4931_c0_g1~~TRINITY_DN4931_c0_g1_i6.p1  ORF type:complete len:322 (-),score=94.14 TRINITY_DN4931_c0_g1_i6:53-1018(-)
MIPQQVSDEAFQKVFENPDNRICFDCAAPADEWTSVNNGIIICANCAAIHRSLGVSVSYVRSIKADAWTERQLLFLLNGGNTKFRLLFEGYNIPKDTPVKDKYRTKAAQYYRERLKATVEGLAEPESPALDAGLELIDSGRKVNELPAQTGTALPQEEEKKGDLRSTFSNGLQSVSGFMSRSWYRASSGAKEAANKMSEKWKDVKWREDLKKFGEKVSTTAKQTTSAIIEKSEKFGTAVAEKTTKFSSEAAVIVGKGIEKTEKSLEAAGNYLKGKGSPKRELEYSVEYKMEQSVSEIEPLKEEPPHQNAPPEDPNAPSKTQ